MNFALILFFIGFSEEDLIDLEYELIDNSHLANVMDGTGGLMRVPDFYEAMV